MTISTQFYSFSNLAECFQGFLLDAYGVFWGGNSIGVLPGAREAMEQLVLKGKTVGVLSNSTQLVANEKEKLKAHGLFEGQHYQFFITSGEVAKKVFQAGQLPFETAKKKFWLLGTPHPKYSPPTAIFEGTPYQETEDIGEADFIYPAIPHLHGEDQTDPSLFRDLLKQIVGTGLPMLCANPDRFAHEGNPPRAVVRQGSIGAIYEDLGGQVFYIGKPADRVYLEAMCCFSDHDIIDLQKILMVGDTPETDIRGARRFGMASALVTKTGIMAERVNQFGLETVIQELSPEDYPNYFIERMVII